jgi:hypothetical protein
VTEAGFVERLVQVDAEDVHLPDAHASNTRRLCRWHGDRAPTHELNLK